MKKNLTMLEVLGHDEDYYTEEYRTEWKNDFRLIEKMTKDLTIEEMEKFYDMLNMCWEEYRNMLRYIINQTNTLKRN